MGRSFAGASAIVTGGASGIGFALARGLVDAGARVVVADLDGDAARKAVAEHRRHPSRRVTLRIDDPG